MASPVEFTASVATPRLIAVAPPYATASVGSHHQVKGQVTGGPTSPLSM